MMRSDASARRRACWALWAQVRSLAGLHPYPTQSRYRPTLKAFAVMILAGSSAYAHHSHPNYLLDQNVALEGDIESILFANPHVLMKVRAADSTVYTAEWQGASWFYNRERGDRFTDKRYDKRSFTDVTSSTLKVGDHIVLIGCPPRDPTLHEVVDLKEVRRPRDGWIWQAQSWAATHPSK